MIHAMEDWNNRDGGPTKEIWDLSTTVLLLALRITRSCCLPSGKLALRNMTSFNDRAKSEAEAQPSNRHLAFHARRG